VTHPTQGIGGINIVDVNASKSNPVHEKNMMGTIISLSKAEKIKVITMYSVLAVATLISFLLAIEAGNMYYLLGGLAITCFILGLRHGVDADHIAAIDNTTRKLMQEDKRPLTVGMWFSIGHAITVGLMVLLLVFAADEILHTAAYDATNVFSTAISGLFLYIIAIINVIIVVEIYRVFKGLKNGTINRSQLDCELNNNGFMNRHFGKLFKIVSEPYQMIIVGLLFGLGFDTATETMTVGFAVAASVGSNIPLWAIMTLPLCFACGMIFTDMSDGVSMRLAYGWAFQHPIRKVYYNLTITVMSVMVAFCIGTIELTQVFAQELNWNSGFWGWLQNLDFETLGFVVVALFLSSWLVSVIYYRHKGYEEKFDHDKFMQDVDNCPPPEGS
jgi:high-affinity nickel-transport protein